MKLSQAQTTIKNAVQLYEDARITLNALTTIIDETTKELYDTAYDSGYSVGVTDADLDPDADLDEEEVLFESEFDLDEIRGEDLGSDDDR